MTPADYTRTALVGRADAASPTDGEIQQWQEDAFDDLIGAYPCLSDTYADMDAFIAVSQGARWLGYFTAIQMREGGWRLGAGPAAGYGLAALTVKKADVTEQYEKVTDQGEERAGWDKVIGRCMAAFPCVLEAEDVPTPPRILNLAGNKRLRDAECEC